MMPGNFLSSLEFCQHLHCEAALGIVEGYSLALKGKIGIPWVMCTDVLRKSVIPQKQIIFQGLQCRDMDV